jgi:deazaflavin-dependent oxidoreductase (nitroreductase family)
MGLWDELGCHQGLPNRWQRGIQVLAATAPGARLFSLTQRHLDRVTERLTRGRVNATQPFSALPTVTLATTGARSGARREAYLVAIPADGDIAVIGSNYGGRNTPGWVHNLRADPAVEVRLGQRTLPATARLLTGSEAEKVWATARAMYPGFASYPVRASHREITVWRLTARA